MISAYGNCQAKEVVNMLLTSENFTNKYGTSTYIALNYIFEKEHQPLDVLIESFKKTKILIYQPLSDKHYPYNTDNLLQYLPSDCKLVSFPYIFNDALWGHSVDGNWKDAVNGDFILSENVDMLARFEYNLAITLEKEQNTVVKLSSYIRDHIRDVELFYTQNHPTPYLLREVCRQMLDYLQITNDIPTSNYETYYGTFRWPYTAQAVLDFNFKFPLNSQII